MLTVHHLGRSQSERVVWLCEELGLDYRLIRYERDAETKLAPPEYKALHPMGAAPVITDGAIVLAESVAIFDFILARHGNGRFVVAADQPAFADYLYWFHFANGTLHPSISRAAVLDWAGLDPANPTRAAFDARRTRAVAAIDGRLGQVPYLAGEAFTAADMMTVYSLTTGRLFSPFEIAPFANVLAYLRRIAERPGYQAAMAKGDPGLAPLLS